MSENDNVSMAESLGASSQSPLLHILATDRTISDLSISDDGKNDSIMISDDHSSENIINEFNIHDTTKLYVEKLKHLQTKLEHMSNNDTVFEDWNAILSSISNT